MNLVTFLATYIMIWWIFLFMALPWGNTAPQQVIQGVDPGAPEKPRLGLKILVVSVSAGLCCLALHFSAPFWKPVLMQWLTT